MNLERITIQDCIDLYEKKGIITIINTGQVIGLVKEKRTQGSSNFQRLK